MLHDRHALAKPLRLFHVVGGEEDRLSFAMQLQQDVPERQAALRIDAGGRFVEEEHFRPVHERSADQQPLLHAARKLVHERLSALLQPDQLQHAGRLPARVAPVQAEIASVVIEVLPGGQAPVKRVELRDHADYPFNFLLAGTDADAGDPHLSARRHHSGRQHADRGRLPGPVGPQQTEELAVLNFQVERIDRPRAARIDFGKAPRLDRLALLRNAVLGRAFLLRLGR